jgi:hypothetical protein
MEETNKIVFEDINYNNDIYLEEEVESLEVAGSWGSLGTFASAAGSCASTVGSASSFG